MQDKRVHRRIPVNLSVSIERAGGEPIPGLVRDMSLGGAFVEAEAEFHYGEELTIVGRLPGADEDSRLKAVVRWLRAPGFGVQFGLLGARDTRAIARLLQPQ